MKTITIKQPYADVIVEGIKDIENRTWPTKFRGRVLIHASAMQVKARNVNYPHNEIWQMFVPKDNLMRAYFSKNTTSAIVGSVEIIDCVINHPSAWAEKCEPIYRFGTDKIVQATYNWVLANPIKFPEPIPAKGKLSFWDYPNILAEQEEKGGELFCHCQLSVKEESQVSGDSHFGYYCRYCGGKWYK